MIESIRSRGIYFLANDGIYDLVVTFLNSVRAHDQDIDICFIPFDKNSSRIRALSDRFRFDEFDDAEILAACDEISKMIHGCVKGHYRKLACFEGAFREFIYFDCDTVVTRNPSFCFPMLESFDFLFSHSDEERLVRWVWKDSIHASGLLSMKQIEFSANTGFMVSKRHALRVAKVAIGEAEIAPFVPHMILECVEQPLLNLLVVTSGQRYGSLLALVKSGTFKNIPLEKWAGKSLLYRGRDSVDHVTNTFFLYHWAGSWAPTKVDRLIDRVLCFFMPSIKPATVRRLMPNGRIWRKYRNMDYYDGVSKKSK